MMNGRKYRELIASGIAGMLVDQPVWRRAQPAPGYVRRPDRQRRRRERAWPTGRSRR